MDNHTKTPDLLTRLNDAHRRLEANHKESLKRLYELHAEGVPSNIDIGDAWRKAATARDDVDALKKARDAALSRDEVYQRLLSEEAKLDHEIDTLIETYFKERHNERILNG